VYSNPSRINSKDKITKFLEHASVYWNDGDDEPHHDLKRLFPSDKGWHLKQDVMGATPGPGTAQVLQGYNWGNSMAKSLENSFGSDVSKSAASSNGCLGFKKEA